MPLHPPFAHFAIVLPIVAAVFGLIYLIKPSESMSKVSTRLLVFAALAMIATWYTGSKAGPMIYDYLSSEGKHELIEHKNLGLYLAIAFGGIAVLKLLGCQLKRFALEAAAVFLLVIATVFVLIQGKHGGEITYKYGEPFKAPLIIESLKEASATAGEAEECDAQVEAYEEAVDGSISLSEEVDELFGKAKKPKE